MEIGFRNPYICTLFWRRRRWKEKKRRSFKRLPSSLKKAARIFKTSTIEEKLKRYYTRCGSESASNIETNCKAIWLTISEQTTRFDCWKAKPSPKAFHLKRNLITTGQENLKKAIQYCVCCVPEKAQRGSFRFEAEN